MLRLRGLISRCTRCKCSLVRSASAFAYCSADPCVPASPRLEHLRVEWLFFWDGEHQFKRFQSVFAGVVEKHRRSLRTVLISRFSGDELWRILRAIVVCPNLAELTLELPTTSLEVSQRDEALVDLLRLLATHNVALRKFSVNFASDTGEELDAVFLRCMAQLMFAANTLVQVRCKTRRS